MKAFGELLETDKAWEDVVRSAQDAVQQALTVGKYHKQQAYRNRQVRCPTSLRVNGAARAALQTDFDNSVLEAKRE